MRGQPEICLQMKQKGIHATLGLIERQLVETKGPANGQPLDQHPTHYSCSNVEFR